MNVTSFIDTTEVRRGNIYISFTQQWSILAAPNQRLIIVDVYSVCKLLQKTDMKGDMIGDLSEAMS
jgi:hypothetical protein